MGDVRPVGIWECLRRAITATVVGDMRDVFADHFWPQQFAVGVPSGLSALAFG